MVSGAMDISSDPSCCRVTDPDKALNSNPGLDDTLAVLATQLGMVLVVAQPLGTNMVTGCALDPGHPCGL